MFKKKKKIGFLQEELHIKGGIIKLEKAMG